MKVFLKWFGIVLVIALVAAQFVPVNRDNPTFDPSKAIYAAGAAPANVQSILQRSCKDCHSSETHWPWYSHVAPASWLLASDVHDGRKRMNFSEWATYTEKRKEDKQDAICDMVSQNEMPPWQYTLIHRDAVLSQQDRDTLCQWAKSPGTTVPSGSGSGGSMK